MAVTRPFTARKAPGAPPNKKPTGLIRQIIGDRDETLRFNRDFHQHLDALKIPHAYRQLPGIPHNPNLLLNSLGEDNWGFYRMALAEGRSTPPERGTGGQ